MKQIVTKGATDQTVYVFIADASVTTGAGLTGLAFNTAGLVASYVRPLGSRQAISLVTQTVTGAHTDGGFVEVDATNMPGIYRLDLPDAVVASGVNSAIVTLQGAADMVPVSVEIQLVAANLQDATRLGLAALPNAAADAAGGLPISDAGGLDIDTLLARLDAAISTRLASASYTAPLDAAGTRTAVGLASANLDTQLSTIDTEVGQIKAKTDSLTFTGSDVRATLDGETVTVGALSSNVITTASIADSALTAAKFSGVFPANFSSVTVTSGRLDANLTLIGGADIIGGLSDIIGTLATSTALGDVDTDVAWIANAIAVTLDPNLTAVKAVTDKLDDTLEDDAGTFRFTENALEQAPSGGGGGATLAEIVKLLFSGRQVFWASPSGTGDGASPETPDSLADAVAAANAVTGVVALLPGTYTLSSYPLTLSDGVALYGPGAGVAKIINAASGSLNVVLSVGQNNLVRGVTVENVSGIQLSTPVGSRTATNRRVVNSVFEDCVFVSPNDCCFMEAPADDSRHHIVFRRCWFDSEWDGFTVFGASSEPTELPGTNVDAYFHECRFTMRGLEGRAIYVNVNSAATAACRIYAFNCVFTRRSSSANVGAAVDVSGANVEVRLVNCISEGASDLGGASSLSLRAVQNAKIVLSAGTVHDRSRTATATGGSIAFAPPGDTIETNLDDQVSGITASVDPQDIRDAMKLAPSAGDPAAGSIDAKINAIEGGAGSGSEEVTLTINDSGGSPVLSADVWVTAANDSQAAPVASAVTNGSGQVTLYLDPGTYYVWRQKPGVNFTNPQQITVASS